ncbi:MAG TPA: hypothetical protein P5533_02065, partial [Candidatus Cloacimonadota bacterium]|nr:hypothetical protein [Candidatus Cloacimonadota bacterium]
MKRISCLFIFLLLLNAVFGALVLEGDISTNTTLLQSNNPHQIRGYVRVMDGVTLTIDPGVTLKFENGSTLRVEGAVSANGSYEQPIVFTSITGDDLYTRIELQNAEASLFQNCTMGRSSDGTALLKIINSPGVTMNNVSVGTSNAHGIYISNSAVNLNSCSVGNVGGRALSIEGSGSVISLLNFSVNGCQSGIYVQPGAYPALTWGGINIQNSWSYPVVAGLFHYTNLGSITVTNTDPAVRMLAIWETGIWNNATLPYKSIPYLLQNNLSVGNSTLSLEPGVGLCFSQHGRLTIGNNAALVAEGTELLPITFYPSGSTTWKGLSFEVGSSGLLDHCSFNACGHHEYGPEPSIYANGMANLSISNSIIPGGTSNGIVINGYHNGSLNLSNVQIVNCPDTGLLITDSTISLDYTNLSISGCGRAIALPANLIDFLDEQPQFSGNTDSRIIIHNDGYLRRNTTFRNWGYPYVSQAYNIGANYIALNIQPGCVFQLGNDVGFNCNGSVSALGTADQPILFTRIPGTDAHWRGFVLDAGISSAQFDHCILEHCALLDQYSNPGEAFRLYRPNSVTISNTTIINAACRGIFIESNNGSSENPDNLSINNLTIDGCGWEGLLQQDGSYHININGLNISGCNSYPLSISANWIHQVANLTLEGNTHNLIRILGGGNFASQTLGNHGYPYLVSSYNPYIYSNLSLVPGTVFYFEENRSLEVYGTISATGSAAQPIIFDRVPGSACFWQSIYLRNGCNASFEHCRFNNCGERNEHGYDNAFFENAGATLLSLQNCQINNVDAQALSCYDIGSGDSVSLNNLLINGCRTDGIVCLDTDLTLNTSAVTISNCLRYPLNIYSGFAGSFPGLVLSDNTNNHILLSGSTGIGNVSFPNYGYVYRCTVNLYIYQGCTLNIAPGCVFWMEDNRYLDVAGGISAPGTQDQPVSFTRYPTSSGYWQGIIFRNNSGSNLAHCQILWAGATDAYNDRRAVHCQGASSLTFSNCLI